MAHCRLDLSRCVDTSVGRQTSVACSQMLQLTQPIGAGANALRQQISRVAGWLINGAVERRARPNRSTPAEPTALSVRRRLSRSHLFL